MPRTLVPLDRLWLAERDGDVWVLSRKDDKGVYREQERWTGPRHSLYFACEQRGIVPSRDADRQLMQLPEQSGFRDDDEEDAA
jgi:hypothetical protein